MNARNIIKEVLWLCHGKLPNWLWSEERWGHEAEWAQGSSDPPVSALCTKYARAVFDFLALPEHQGHPVTATAAVAHPISTVVFLRMSYAEAMDIRDRIKKRMEHPMPELEQPLTAWERIDKGDIL
jgi:hypothetical protein